MFKRLRWIALGALVLLGVALYLQFARPVLFELFLLELDRYAFHIGDFRLTPVSLFKIIVGASFLFWASTSLSLYVNRYIGGLRKLNKSTKDIIGKTSDVAIYFVAFLLCLDFVGIEFTTLAVFGGALGVGIGFGLQRITSNFVSGIILLFEKSIKVGDLIEMDAGIFGFIRKLGARFTLVETYDGKEVFVPNEDFITNKVTNWTYSNSNGRVAIEIGVSYRSDIHLVQRLILEAAVGYVDTLEDPAPIVYLRNFGDSSVDFLLHFFIGDVKKGRFIAQSQVMFAIWDLFKKNGIEIPFPQRDVHIHQVDAPQLSSKKTLAK